VRVADDRQRRRLSGDEIQIGAFGSHRQRLARWLGEATRAGPAGPQILRAFADAYPNAVFIEIGANDGVQQDHIRPFIVSFPWRGVMVEPLPWVFAHLRSNYRGQKGVTFENAAIADADGRVPFYYIPPAADRGVQERPIWSDMIGSLSRHEVERAVFRIHDAFSAPIPEVEIESTEVLSLTFESLCRRHEIRELDLLVIDAEGHDYEIIKGIDFERHRPRLLIYENNHLSADEREESRAYLERLGYETMDETIDTWCHDPRAADSLARCWRSVRRRRRVGSLLHQIRTRLLPGPRPLRRRP
jgi:FkbM family methyltransferase